MSSMEQMVTRVLKNTSPAELRHIKKGDLSVAEWIASKVLDVTPTQAESVALRVWESVK